MAAIRFSPALNKRITLLPFFTTKPEENKPLGLNGYSYMEQIINHRFPNFSKVPLMGRIYLHELLAAAHRAKTISLRDRVRQELGAGQLSSGQAAFKGFVQKEEQTLEFLVKPLQGFKEGQRVRVSTLARKLIEVHIRALKDLRASRPGDAEAPVSQPEYIENASLAALAGIAGIEGVLGLLRHPMLTTREREWLACQVFARKNCELGTLFAQREQAMLQHALADLTGTASDTFKRYLSMGLVSAAG